MPFGFKEGKTNADTDKNTPTNQKTKIENNSINSTVEEEKIKLLTSLHKKTEEKNGEKENKRFDIGIGTVLLGQSVVIAAALISLAGSGFYMLAGGLVYAGLFISFVGIIIHHNGGKW